MPVRQPLTLDQHAQGVGIAQEVEPHKLALIDGHFTVGRTPFTGRPRLSDRNLLQFGETHRRRL
jgi:hypothetical protein